MTNTNSSDTLSEKQKQSHSHRPNRSRIDPKEMLEIAQKLREKTAHCILSAEELQAAKEDGRS
jgi:hypothetical protein